jgi:hypothetical protein
VSQLVRCEPLEAGPSGGWREHPSAEVVQPQHATVRGGEHQVFRIFPDQQLRHLVDHRSRNWHRSTLVVLRLAPLELAGHLGDCLGHLQATAHQVHSPGAQGGELAELQAGVGHRTRTTRSS